MTVAQHREKRAMRPQIRLSSLVIAQQAADVGQDGHRWRDWTILSPGTVAESSRAMLPRAFVSRHRDSDDIPERSAW
jgi:hypothetical protein